MEQYEFRFIGIETAPIRENEEDDQRYWITAIESTACGHGGTIDGAISRMLEATEHLAEVCEDRTAGGIPCSMMLGEERMDEGWIVRNIEIYDSIMNEIVAETDEEEKELDFIGGWFVAGIVHGNVKDGFNVRDLRVLEREGCDEEGTE